MAMGETIQFVVRHGYLVIFFWLLAEQAALPIPSLPLLLVSGALVRTGQLKLSSVLGYAFVACAIGIPSGFTWESVTADKHCNSSAKYRSSRTLTYAGLKISSSD